MGVVQVVDQGGGRLIRRVLGRQGDHAVHRVASLHRQQVPARIPVLVLIRPVDEVLPAGGRQARVVLHHGGGAVQIIRRVRHRAAARAGVVGNADAAGGIQGHQRHVPDDRGIEIPQLPVVGPAQEGPLDQVAHKVRLFGPYMVKLSIYGPTM